MSLLQLQEHAEWTARQEQVRRVEEEAILDLVPVILRDQGQAGNSGRLSRQNVASEG